MATKLAKIVADFRTSLATKLSAGASSCSIQSATDDDGVALPAGKYFFTLDGDNSQKEHILADLSGVNLTNIKSVSRQGVQTANAVREHRAGATVTITDFAHILYLNDLLSGATALDASNPLAYDADPDLTGNNKKLATVKLVEDTAIAGGADASTTVKGITKLSVAPASATEPIAVGVNDPKLPPVDTSTVTAGMVAALGGTSGTPGAMNPYVTNDDTATAATADKIARRGAGGNITVVTESQADNSTKSASTAYVDTAKAAVQALITNNYIGVGVAEAKSYIQSQMLFRWSSVSTLDNWSRVGMADSQNKGFYLIGLQNNGGDSAQSLTSSIPVSYLPNGNPITFGSNKDIITEFNLSFSSLSENEQMGWGLTNNAAATQDYDQQLYDSVMFTYNRTGGVEYLYAKTSNAAVGHTETLLSNITLQNFNLFRIEFNPGVNAKFYINGSLVATITTNLPDAENVYFSVGSSGSGITPYLLSAPSFAIEK